MSERTSSGGGVTSVAGPRRRRTVRPRSSAPLLPVADEFVARLASDGVTRGLIGPREVPRLWERHVLNSAAIAEAVPAGRPRRRRRQRRGTAGHPPGHRPAGPRPDPASSRWPAGWSSSSEVVAGLAEPAGLRWRVVRGRAEERSVAKAVGPVDVVTARAVAPLPRLVGWCRGLMRPGTQLVALVGASALAGLPALVPELEAAGMRDVHARAVGAGLGDAATTVVVMTRGAR